MLTERQQDILFETLGYATIFAFIISLLITNTQYYLVAAAITVTLAVVYAGIGYLSAKGDDA